MLRIFDIKLLHSIYYKMLMLCMTMKVELNSLQWNEINTNKPKIEIPRLDFDSDSIVFDGIEVEVSIYQKKNAGIKLNINKNTPLPVAS